MQNQTFYFVDVHAPPSMPVSVVGHAKQPEPSFLSKKIRFTYIEVQEMTNNFQRVLGEGGFGIVYHGCINLTLQVAVKLLSQSSSQGYKHFKAEVLFCSMIFTTYIQLLFYLYLIFTILLGY